MKPLIDLNEIEAQLNAHPIQNFWTQQQAIELCRKIEAIAPSFGCHVALTGGLLYKDGSRKDCDLLFYRIRQVPKINTIGLLVELSKKGVTVVSGFGWIRKAVYDGRSVDLFFPEEKDCPEPTYGGTTP